MNAPPKWPHGGPTSPGDSGPEMAIDRDALLLAAKPKAIEPLTILLDSLETEAHLTPAAEVFTEQWLTRLVTGAAAISEWFATDPGTADEPVTAPIIVAGAPRTGTTFLHRLLAQDPAARAPEGWELLTPVPPPRVHTPDDDPRILAADVELTWPQRQRAEMRTIHRYAGRMHKECLSAMSFSFRSEEFISRYRVPTYVEWLQAGDITPAYEMHRRVFQLLQRHQPTTRWVLKSPVHLNSLPTVLRTYPDARVVITHREPAEVLGSVTSLIATLRRAFSEEVDEAEIARYHLDLYGRSLDALVDYPIDPEQIFHVDHHELTANTQATIDRLYDHFGMPSINVDDTPPAEAGLHEYGLVGIDPTEIDRTFARYRERFLSVS